MLPAEYRLKINSRTTNGWKKKSVIHTPGFKLVYEIFASEDKPKIGFIVSGKTGNAVERNRKRRLLIEVLRGKIDRFPKGIKAVLIVNKEVPYNHEDVNDWLDKALANIKQN